MLTNAKIILTNRAIFVQILLNNVWPLKKKLILKILQRISNILDHISKILRHIVYIIS